MSETTSTTTQVLPLSNVTYDRLRKITQYWLPAVAVFYSALALLWGFDYSEQIVGSIVAFVALANVMLGVSNASYKKSDAPFDGAINVDSGALVGLNVDLTAEEIKNKGTVVLKVKDVTDPSQ